MKIRWAGKQGFVDITQVVSSVSWGGSVSQAARTAEIALTNAPNDENIVKLKLAIAAGDVMELYEGERIFLGQVITKETTGETGTITFSCVDFLNHLLKSTGTYNFKNTTAEKITKRLCDDFSIEQGKLIKTDVMIKKMIIDGENIYDIIMMAYTKAALQTGKKYICRMDGEKLSVTEKGDIVKKIVLEDGKNIANVTQEESIDNMVNIVKIYDDTGKQTGEIKKEEWIKKYGIYQQIYKKEQGINANTAAGAILQGVRKNITLEGINGDISCIAGNGIKVRDKVTRLNGLFWIDSDTHTWENGIHKMTLDLNFRNIMDEKEVG